MFVKSKHLSFFFCCLFCSMTFSAFSQSLQGKVLDKENGEPLIGACIIIINTETGNCTDIDGNFIIENSPAPPFDIKVTYLGYDSLVTTVTDLRIPLELGLESTNLNLQTVTVSAENSSLKRDVALTVESIGLREIESTTESSFYDALASVREIDMLAVSFGVKVINARGFNTSTPTRSLQLIDGVDNASPGLNYPLGNFFGAAELDIEGVDLVIGAASAYFGPGAFNGVVNMRTKDPYNHQGLDVVLKAGERDFLEVGFRYAKAFKNKSGKETFAFKINASYNQVYDWEANEYGPKRGRTRDSLLANPGGFDGVNVYGDEGSANFSTLFEQFRHPGLNRYHRTGYKEEDIVDYDSYNLKTTAALHYRFGRDWEAIAFGQYGRGTTVMQLDNRLQLKDVWATQYRFELKQKDRFFFRFYTTGEDAGKSFDIISTAQQIQNSWRSEGDWFTGYKNHWFRNINPQVKEFEGFPTIGPPPDFFYDFEKAKEVLEANNEEITQWHQETRAAQDGGFLQSGTPEFQEVFDRITGTPVLEGGTMFVDESKLYHWHTEYKFKPTFVDEITVGGNLRLYRPYSEGSIFSDTSGTIIKTHEFGAYVGLEKWLLDDRMKLNFALRMDKHENYDYLFSPTFSAIYSLSPASSLRFSFSSALRSPTLIEQYFYLRVGSAILLGNIQGYDDLIDLDSFEEYLDNGLDPSLLEYFSSPALVPEKVLGSELAYANVFLKGKLDLKMTLYFNRYEDFIGNRIGLKVPFFRGFPGIPTIFRFAANALDVTYTAGLSTGLSYRATDHLNLSANHSYNQIFQVSDDPLIPSYNTPKNKINLSIGVHELTIGKSKHWSVGTNLRWVEGYTFDSSPQFSGRIPPQYYINAQISKEFPKLRSTFKISGSNLLNRAQNGLFGGPSIGRFVHGSWRIKLH